MCSECCSAGQSSFRGWPSLSISLEALCAGDRRSPVWRPASHSCHREMAFALLLDWIPDLLHFRSLVVPLGHGGDGGQRHTVDTSVSWVTLLPSGQPASWVRAEWSSWERLPSQFLWKFTSPLLLYQMFFSLCILHLCLPWFVSSLRWNTCSDGLLRKESMGGKGFETLHVWKCFHCPLSLDDRWAGYRIPGWKSFFFRILKALLRCRLAFSESGKVWNDSDPLILWKWTVFSSWKLIEYSFCLQDSGIAH